MFLVGKSIPEHIRNLPETFLNTPFGQMMKPQIDMALRGVTQAPGQGFRPQAPARAPAPTQAALPTPSGTVKVVTSLPELENALASASNTCAVIFFTSATCPPCKAVYPVYDELAEETASKAVLVKVDIGAATGVGMKYSVHATPTFMTFLKGEKLDQWSGANPAQIRGNVRMLVEMAHPVHPHRKLKLPSFQRQITNYVLYKKVPPLEKLVQKLGDDYSKDPTIASVIEFIKSSHSDIPADTPVPDLSAIAKTIQSIYPSLPNNSKFALVDLVRLLFIDPRVSGYFAEEPSQHTLLTLLSPTLSKSEETCPYKLRIILLQLSCNLFSTPLYPTTLISNAQLRDNFLNLATSSLLDSEHPAIRVVAASLIYNLATYNHNARWEGKKDVLSEETQVELTAGLVEQITHENGDNAEALRGLLFALGLLVYEADVEGEVVELCRVLGAKDAVSGKESVVGKKTVEERLVKELGVLLGAL